jgi:tetratricopeptide (TPR) repeat protein
VRLGTPGLVLGTPRGATALVVTLLLGAGGFLPQFGGPGYEAALLGGVVLPSASAICAALTVAAKPSAPSRALFDHLASAALFAGIGFLLLLLHGLRVGFCDPSEGLWLFALGPACGALMGAVWGTLVGFVAARPKKRWQRRTAAVLLALAGPVGGIVVSLVRFYTSPMVFAFDPFFGYFSGPLYDTVIDPFLTLVTYRIGSAATLVFALVLAQHVEIDAEHRLKLAWIGRPGLFALGAGALVGSVVHVAYGPELGHYSTTSSIEAALGRRTQGKRCDVVYSSAILERDLHLFLRDCDAQVVQLERWFGVRGPDKIKVYLFASDAEKGRLMGASRTYIAKPWREEVYLQQSSYPHPVVRHELAHVIAGRFGQGPFKIAGPLGGIVPDPGRIEGIAVAAAPDEDEELSDLEWTAAMQRLDLLPELERIFRLGFLGQPSSRAYTVAGSFVNWFAMRFGMDKVRAWYGGAELPELTGGKDLRALEREFLSYLEKVPLPEKSLETARLRFDRPAFFARSCPRIVDRLYGQAEQRLSVGDWKEASERYREVLRLDPHHTGSRFGLAHCAKRRGDEQEALRRFIELSSSKELSKVEQASALEAAGDLKFAKRQTKEAEELYAAASRVVFDEGRLRTLDVKRWAREGLAYEAIATLLVGNPELGPSWDVAAPLLGIWGEREPEQGVSSYLIGRNLMLRGRYFEAALHLDRAIERELPLASVRREALRNRLTVACALLDRERAKSVLEELAKLPELSASQREGLASFGERCLAP